MSYAGDVTCKECWHTLSQDPDAQLVDVRTVPEWAYVGIPELDSINKNPVLAEWQQFPTMQVNPDFAAIVSAKLQETGADKNAPVFMLCRSGVRSIAAAETLTAAGFTAVYNILGGFEGDLNKEQHRSHVSGWKHDELPWKQR